MHSVKHLIAVLVLAAFAGNAAAESGAASSRLHPSLEKDALRAVDLGLRWLEQRQQPDGHWSLAQFPALTALVIQGYLNDPARQPMEVAPHVGRGLEYIVGCARDDGGIYHDVPRRKGGGLRNYNTAICMSALAASGDVAYDPVIRRAREFLARLQCADQGAYRGGFGYDLSLQRPYADMTNTTIAIEAFRFTQFVVDNSCAPPLRQIQDRPRAGKDSAGKDLDWQAAVSFLEQCQNRPNKDPDRAVSPRPQDRGGFFYEPNRGQAGGEKDAQGRPLWYSYGTATYGGLLSLLLAEVERDDPRVQGAVDWVRRNWTLDEHPGMGAQGLYFYYYTIAKALRAYGRDELQLADGRTVNWRTELAQRLCARQLKDAATGLAYWVNENGRWMENDPVLVTAYAVLALEMALSDTAP